MKNIFRLVILLGLISCREERRTGIEGNNNSNNTVIVADKVEYPDEEARKFKFNYNITAESVAGIKLDQTINEVQQFFKKNTNFKFQTDEGARGGGTDFDFPEIYIKDSTNTVLFGIISGDLKVVDGFEVFSSQFKTYNGIYPGMSVRELSSLYGNHLILHINEVVEEEYFSPFDLQGEKTSTIIYVRRDINTPSSSILKTGFNYETEENYDLDGVVASIFILRKQSDSTSIK